MYIYKNKAFRLEYCVILDLGLGVGREEHVHEREKEDIVLVLPKGSLFYYTTCIDVVFCFLLQAPFGMAVSYAHPLEIMSKYQCFIHASLHLSSRIRGVN